MAQSLRYLSYLSYNSYYIFLSFSCDCNRYFIIFVLADNQLIIKYLKDIVTNIFSYHSSNLKRHYG